MAQDSLSSTTQSVGNPGPLILTWTDPAPPNGSVSVSFSPAKAHIVKPEFAPVQRINISDDGHVHIFQLSTNETLRWDIDFEELPWADDPTGQKTEGWRTLRQFIRTTLNYSQYSVTITSPDGDIESMIYVGGLDTFQEAQGRGTRREFWNGTLTFTRFFP